MGYLNKQTITVDAILTNKGREILAKGGRNGFEITKFAVADDEIDYGLYNDAHPDGDAGKGFVIENMPVLEATPDEQQIMRYKLLTATSNDILTDNTVYQPIIDGVRPVNLTISSANGQVTSDKLTFSTKGGTGAITEQSGTETGYTVLIADGTLVDIYRGEISAGTSPYNNNNTNVDTNGSITVNLNSATNAVISFKARPNKIGRTTATVFGNTSGATATFVISVTAATT